MWCALATYAFALRAVAEAGKILQGGGTALDAAESGTRIVESDPTVDCVGRGGFMNWEGFHELDAAVMNGDTLDFGAVAAVKHFEHPVSIARAVMEKTGSAFLISDQAEYFARCQGFVPVSDEYMITEAARRFWIQDKGKAVPPYSGHDTVSMITLDQKASMAVATSTSGAGLKLPGRVGDAPIIGSGFYADSRIGAAATTGMGEDIMRTCCSMMCVDYLKSGLSPTEAATETVIQSVRRIKGHHRNLEFISIICMNPEGEVGGATNMDSFGYAMVSSSHPLDLVTVTPAMHGGV